MKLKKEELKKQEKNSRQINEITEAGSHPGLWCNRGSDGESCNNTEQERKVQKFGKFVSLTSKGLQR